MEEEYMEKRNFEETPEPTMDKKVKHTGKEPIFVVQKHEASHLHFDFRLEVDGVLKSWAVPKGPAMNPKEKRLAIEVEDHPLAYAKFEGTIPEGNYGAGTVEIWDKGTYTPVEKHRDVNRALEEGVFEFSLHGRKLKGLFSLVRTNFRGDDRNWLLLKIDDQYAVHHEYEAVDIPS